VLEEAPRGAGARRDSLRADLVRYFEDHRKLVESDALTLLLTSPEPVLLSRRLVDGAGGAGPFVTRRMVEEALRPRASVEASGSASGLGRGFPAERLAPAGPASAIPAAFELLSEGFNPTAPGADPLAAYGSLFASRFEALERLLKGRSDLPNLVPVRELRSREGSASVIGMIRELRQTSEKKHLILEVEDPTGSVELLVPKDHSAARQTWLVDEVVGVHLKVPRERNRIPIATALVRPDVPTLRVPRRGPPGRRVAFLSDLHIGSKSFMGEEWQSLVAFLREEGPHPEVAREVAHVVIAGDLVDGIGIYPHQESDLAIHDIFDQYAELGKRLRELPARLEVIVIPGNHDAVCPAEPQPTFPEEIRALLPPNVRAVGNPSTFALDGVVVEAYHGRSFDDLIPALPGSSYARPTEVMKTMLAMRHLAPIYGGRTPLAPLPRDGFVVDPVPDILVTGHAHTYGVDQYRGILLLNASTWQAETAYQRMRNITPIPCHAAIVRLNDLAVETYDFEGPRPRATGAAA
jgi:DNA polymerase II small subunit